MPPIRPRARADLRSATSRGQHSRVSLFARTISMGTSHRPRYTVVIAMRSWPNSRAMVCRALRFSAL